MHVHSEKVAQDSRRPPQHRVWSASYRVLVSLLIALVFHGAYAGWHWQVKHRSGRGLFVVSPTGEIWRKSSTRTIVTGWLQESLRMWSASISALSYAWQSRLIYTIPTLLPSSLVGVFAFVLITRWRGPPEQRDPYCRCRRCGYILAGLDKPRCPECGEAI